MKTWMKPQRVLVTRLVEDFDFYPRADVSSQHIAVLADVLAGGGKLPPITVEAKTLRVVDGFHRKRAHMRAFGAEAMVPCILREYSNEREMYQEAMRLNSTHGRALSTYDRAHAINRGIELKIDPELIAKDLGISLERVQTITAARAVDVIIPGAKKRGRAFLKRSVANMRGKLVTEAQADVIKGLGSDPQIKMIRDLTKIIRTDMLDVSRDDVLAALADLCVEAEALLAENRQAVG